MPTKKKNPYPEGTVALVNIKTVNNVKAFRRKTSAGYDWAFSPVPELGLNTTCANDDEVEVVKVLEVEDVPSPESKVYDVDSMTPSQLLGVINDLLNTDNRDDEYDDTKGADGFWHLLAGTKQLENPNDKWSRGVTLSENAKYISDGVILVPQLGTFTRIEFTSDWNESGDLDCMLIFKLGERYFRMKSDLDSWSQGNWEYGLGQVRPIEVTVTKWEKI